MADQADWISISDAARRLTAAGDAVDRSTLSRYLKQHGEALPLRREGRSNLVDFVALSAHRRENIRIRAQASPEAKSAASESSPADGAGDARFGKSQITGTARKAMAEAELKELELAERRGELVPVAEVETAMRDAIALMRSAFDRAVDSEAATISVKYRMDERIARLVLKGFVRHGVDTFHRRILERMDRQKRAAGEPDLRDRHEGLELQ